MKKLLMIILAIVMTTAFISCGSDSSDTETADATSGVYAPNQSETAYGYTHGGYVGKADLKVDAEGNLSLALDEAFLPHVLAGVDIEADGWDENNTVPYSSHGRVSYVAKYVEYNGKVYVGVPAGSTFIYVEADENGNPAGDADLEKAIIKNQATMAAYFALANAGGFKIMMEFGGTAEAVTTTSYGGITKKNSPGYWGGDAKPGWKGNMKAIEDFVAANGVRYSLSEMVKAKDDNAEGLKPWTVADTVTGATNSDFKDYFGLAQLAAGRLKLK